MSYVESVKIKGHTDNGQYIPLAGTQEGHLEVSLHDPILPFGSIHTESLTPIYQFDAVYGIDEENELLIATGSGTASASDGMFYVSTGTTQYSQGVLVSKKRLRYRAGQGIVGRFTTLFTPPVSGSYQLVGLGHAEAGIYIGYGNTNNLADTSLGILHVTDGVRETKTLTVTAGATSNGNVAITLNGTSHVVPVTNSSNIQRTCWEISQGTYTGWDVYPVSASVVFVRNSAGVTAGTQSFSAGATGAGATIVQTVSGVASTDTFYPQSAWNGDKLNGSGYSGATIDPTKLNIWQISVGYLGTDSLVVKNKVNPPDGNNSTWVIVNTIRFPNSRTTPIFSNPSFPFTMAAYSAGSTTNLTVKSASIGGFIEGKKMLHGGGYTYFNQLATVGPTNLQALFTILNAWTFKGKVNQSVINILSCAGAVKHTSPVVFYLIKNGSLGGNPNFQTLANNSCSLWDSVATTVTYSTGNQVIKSFPVGETGQFREKFDSGEYNIEDFVLQPGEWITLAAKASAGNPQYVNGVINTKEDH